MNILTEAKSMADVLALADKLPPQNTDASDAARARQMTLTKPPGSLGRLEDLAIFMAGWQGTDCPDLSRAQALVFAGNHGVCDKGVNPFPQEVTAQMVRNFQAGGAAINQLCQVAGADLSVIALDLETPTADFSEGPAMSESEVLDAMRKGAEAVDPDSQILVLGEMGIGNSTVAAALGMMVFGGTAQDWVGPGTGSDADGMSLKAQVVTQGVTRHAGAKGLEILTAIGGREQAAICGAILEARARMIPVILDGYICTAAAAPLHAANPAFLDHCVVGHASREPGHVRLTDGMAKPPILTLDMALGEGSGAALALMVVRGALACHNGMATFAEAGVSDSA